MMIFVLDHGKLGHPKGIKLHREHCARLACGEVCFEADVFRKCHAYPAFQVKVASRGRLTSSVSSSATMLPVAMIALHAIAKRMFGSLLL